MLKKSFISIFILVVMMGTVGWQSNSVPGLTKVASEGKSIPHLAGCSDTYRNIYASSYVYIIPSGCAFRDATFVQCISGSCGPISWTANQSYARIYNHCQVGGCAVKVKIRHWALFQ